ncbi:GNAT family N-acetyltransferase [Rhizobium sp. CRIBSB]|nr:GNAT family N-acetyltransferase [Rhizobium sp. CRIBSB]
MRLTPLSPDAHGWSTFVAALGDAGLPVDDLIAPQQAFFSGQDGAFGGFAVLGRDVLLRSIVVPISRRGQGVGHALVDALVVQAEGVGAQAVWLLTTDAADFFRRCGFLPVSRDAAPAGVRATRQFAGLCPASATLMHRPLFSENAC